MECGKVRQIIPKYFQHVASEEEIQTVEEHLCVCHDCRTALGELMDKASSAEAVVEIPSQEETTSQSPEEKEDIKYFPGEDLEVSMDKVEDILGEAELVKEDLKDELKEVEPIVPDKEEGKVEGEDSSFEVIVDPPAAVHQELPTESDIEALIIKNLKPIEEKAKESEEKAELPLEEEKEESPKEKAELPLEEEKEQVSESSPETDTSTELKEEEPEKPRPKEEEGIMPLAEEESKESSDGASYTLNGAPLDKGGVGFLEYFCLIGGLAILGFLAYLLLKG